MSHANECLVRKCLGNGEWGMGNGEFEEDPCKPPRSHVLSTAAGFCSVTHRTTHPPLQGFVDPGPGFQVHPRLQASGTDIRNSH